MRDAFHPLAVLPGPLAIEALPGQRELLALCLGEGLDLLDFDPLVLQRLDPNAAADVVALLPPNRGPTAAAWEARLKGTPTDTALAHALAVLWFWWGVRDLLERVNLVRRAGAAAQELDLLAPCHVLARQFALCPHQQATATAPEPACTRADCAWATNCRQPALGARALWENAAVFWAMTLAGAEFWQERTGKPRAASLQQRDQARRRLAVLMASLPGAVCDATLPAPGTSGGAPGQRLRQALAELLDEAAKVLEQELATAANMAELGLHSDAGVPCCGRRALARFGLEDTIRQTLDRAMEKTPESGPLQELRAALSPYAELYQLLAAGAPSAVFDQLERLPAAERALAEVADLEARATFGRARQRLRDGQVGEFWADAAAARRRAETKATQVVLADLFAEACTQQAEALGQTDPDRAIGFLEAASSQAEHPEIDRVLGELLAHRGRRRLSRLQQHRTGMAAAGVTASVRDLRQILTDLDRATTFGVKGLESDRQRVGAWLQETELGLLGLSRQDHDLLLESYAAAEQGDLDRAIRLLRQVLDMVKGEARLTIRRKLASVLVRRADQRLTGVTRSPAAAAVARGEHQNLGRDLTSGRVAQAVIEDLDEAAQHDRECDPLASDLRTRAERLLAASRSRSAIDLRNGIAAGRRQGTPESRLLLASWLGTAAIVSVLVLPLLILVQGWSVPAAVLAPFACAGMAGLAASALRGK